jgi:hypothetical protein
MLKQLASVCLVRVGHISINPHALIFVAMERTGTMRRMVSFIQAECSHVEAAIALTFRMKKCLDGNLELGV